MYDTASWIRYTPPRHTATHSTQHTAHSPQQQQQQSHRAQCVARLREITMSGSDGSADSDHEPEAEAGAGKGEVEVPSSDDDTVKVVSKPLGGRVAASKAAAGFVACRQSNCILYKRHGWLRHVDKERALCPTCTVPVPCKNSNTSNLWRHWKKCDRKAHDAAKNAHDKASAARPRQQTLSFK